MKATSTNHNKTAASPPVYSFYRSNHFPIKQKDKANTSHKHHFGVKFFCLVILVVAVWVLYTGFKTKLAQAPASSSTPASTSNSQTTKQQPAVTSVNDCSGNTLSQLVLVSISQRHLWACDATLPVYNSPVVTGMEFLPADLTPVGTYHIYAKETDVYLKGSDSTGSWDDFVNYWMPFLDNQYGIYGFHDATWRPDNAFGNISPESSSASHGCVECPLTTAKWLYDWTHLGTTVTIES
jgi:hypothetical protein